MRSGDVLKLRLATQGLVGPGFAGLPAVVGALGAMQAQEFAVAKWSIGQRARARPALGDAAVDRALAEGALVRTHILRPTWHFVLREDLRWMMALSAPRVHAISAFYYRQQEVTDRVFAVARTAIERALAGRRLTRKALGAALTRAGLTITPMRLGMILLRAELDLVVMSGGLEGKQQTYALVDDRVPRGRKWPRDQALAELARRYFTSRGPATLKDWSWWSGLTVADGKRAVDMLAGELEMVTVDDRKYWFAPAAARPRKQPSPRVHLLQTYDEYLIAYSESRALAYAPGLSWATTVEGRMFANAVVLDGMVIGQWRRGAGHGTVETLLRKPLRGAAKAALDEEIARYQKFLGRQASATPVVAKARASRGTGRAGRN
jgi:hypothetical protein